MQAAIVAIIVIVAAVIGAAAYYVTLPSPSPSPSGSASPSPTVSPTARLVRVGEAFPIALDPGVGADFASQSAHTNVYDPLVWPTPGGGVIAWIATNWTISSDFLNYTFTIRQGVKFHDGGTLTANDVAFSMQRLLTLGSGYAWIYEPYINNATGITVIDNYTVMFHLNKVEANFLGSLVRLYIAEKATVLANIVTPGPYGSLGDYGTTWLATHEAGSGPYQLKSISVDTYCDLVQFPGYWYAQGVDPLAPTEVDFEATAASSATEKTSMLTKTLEVSDEWQGDSFLDPLNATGYITAESHADVGEYYYMFNTQKAPTDDVYVRKALAYCFDFPTVDTMIYSRFTPSISCVSAILPGALNVTPYYYNLTLAGDMLKQSKYYGTIQNYPITFHVQDEVPERMNDALHFAETAAIIGLKIVVTSIPWGSMIEEEANISSTPNITPMAIDPLFVDTGSMLQLKYSLASQGSFNQCEWLGNATLDAEIADALATMDDTQRLAKYGHIQGEIMDICPGLFIYDFKVVLAVQNYVYIPQMHNASTVVGIQGYNQVCRTWRISPSS
jgi:peptide/nickel transport system substrate-binding protein